MSIKTLSPDMLTEKVIARFEKKVSKGEDHECWPWIGGFSGVGYPYFWTGRAMEGAHRVSYVLLIKETITSKDFIEHKVCDFPSCSNPFHLLKGNAPSNVADMIAKGRRRTERALTDEQTIEVRMRWQQGESVASLAREFSIGTPRMEAIVKGRTYKNLPIYPRFGNVSSIEQMFA